ncbi:MAG: hypothetical protein NTV51_18825 [Verrucomicrobia bacterium]|nr:hypothetical protein [Verrucomicrobiota bacterium]
MATAPSFSFPGRKLTGLLLALPAVVFLLVIALNATDLPRDDDLFSILPFLNRWTDATSWGVRLDLLFEQYFSHRIVLTRLAAAVALFFGGYCNFTWLQIAGWVAWLGVAAHLLRASPRVRLVPLLGLPVMLLLMQPQGATNFLIAMQAVQNLGVIWLSFAALALVLSPGLPSFILSLVLALLAPLASVNGLLVFPVAAAGLALLGQRTRALVFLGVGAVAWALFFRGYSNPQSPFHLVEFFHNAAIMVGATVMFGTVGFPFATGAGGAILALSLVVVLTAGWRRQPSALVLFLAFIGLSVAMAARGRIGWGPTYMEQDRYRAYGLLAMALLYLVFLERIPSPRERLAAFAAIAAAAVFCFLSYASYLPGVTTHRRWTDAMAINGQLGRDFFKTTPDQWPTSLTEWKLAAGRGLVRPPAPLTPSDLATIHALDTVSSPSAPALTFGSELSVALCGYALAPALGTPCPPPEFVVLVQSGRPLALPVNVWRATFKEIPRRRSFSSDRFEAILPEPLLVSGSHPLYGLARDASGKLTVLWQARVSFP